MSDRKKGSTTSAHNEKSVSEQQDEDFEQMQKEMASCNKSNHTPDRSAAPGDEDSARASRSRDAEAMIDADGVTIDCGL